LRKDPDVRRRLHASGAPDVLLELARDARDEEFADLFRRLAVKSPKKAIRLLKRHADIARRVLSREDLLPLLRSRSHRVRLFVIGFLGDFEAGCLRGADGQERTQPEMASSVSVPGNSVNARQDRT